VFQFRIQARRLLHQLLKGQLKDFLDFCAASGRAVSSAPGANSVPKIALTAELYSGKHFGLVADHRVPSEVASELTDLAQSTSENEWCWPLSSHETQLDSVLFNLGGGKKKVLFAPCFSFGWARENM